MKYPKWPKKYRKVTPQMKIQIIKMFKSGMKKIDIARHFGLSPSTISRETDKKIKERSLANSRKLTRKYYKNPSYRKKVIKESSEAIKKRYRTDKKYNQFMKQYSFVRVRERKEERKKYHRMWYLKNKEDVLKKQKKRRDNLFKRKNKNNKKTVMASQPRTVR